MIVASIFIFMGRSNPEAPRHRQQSMVLVPRDTPGVRIERPLTVFGYDDAPHGHMEIVFDDVRVPVENVLLGEGRGFEIAQARLGPGRIHHCMRLIGLAERALECMCRRVKTRVAFGKTLAEQSVTLERIAEARMQIEQARLLTLKAAYMMDTVGNKQARAEIAMIKVVAPNMACRVIDWAIQAHGAAGLSADFPLASSYAHARKLRLADGPDEVHRNQVGRLELAKIGLTRLTLERRAQHESKDRELLAESVAETDARQRNPPDPQRLDRAECDADFDLRITAVVTFTFCGAPGRVGVRVDHAIERAHRCAGPP